MFAVLLAWNTVLRVLVPPSTTGLATPGLREKLQVKNHVHATILAARAVLSRSYHFDSFVTCPCFSQLHLRPLADPPLGPPASHLRLPRPACFLSRHGGTHK